MKLFSVYLKNFRIACGRNLSINAFYRSWCFTASFAFLWLPLGGAAQEQCTVGMDLHAPYWMIPLDRWKLGDNTQYPYPTLAEAIRLKIAEFQNDPAHDGCGDDWHFVSADERPQPFWDKGVGGGTVRTAQCPGGAPLYIWPSGTSICTCPFGQREENGYCTGDPKDSGEPECPNAVGNPINSGTGNKIQFETDYRSAKEELVFRRTYNSDRLNRPVRLGDGWISNFDRSLQFISSTQIAAIRSDGKIYYFYASNGSWVADADISGALIQQPSGYKYFNASNGDIELYDNGGFLQSTVGKNGYTQNYIYSDGTAASGYAYDENGVQTSIPAPAKLLIKVVDSNGREMSFAYNLSNRIVRLAAPDGGVYRYSYSEAVGSTRNLASVTYPDGKTKTYVYNEPSNVSSSGFTTALTGIVDENSSRFATFKYDELGRAISSEHAGGVEKVVVTYDADENNNVLSSSVTDALNTSRSYSFVDILGRSRVSNVSQPCPTGCGNSSAITYDANGNVSSKTDFNGNITNYIYDLTRNLETSRTEAYGTPQARTITTQWHATYRLPTLITEAGKTTSFNYDTSSNLLSETITDTTLNKSRTWSWTYNNLGQVLTADGPRTDVTDVTTKTYYTSTVAGQYTMGDLATVTNALGQVISITKYDGNGRPLSMTDANGVVTTLTYTPRGWLKTKTVNSTQTTTYDYDGVGQVTKITQPDGSYLAYTYDAAHRLTDITDGAGNKTHYTLDAMSNRTKEETFDPTSALKKSRSRVYDALNRLQQDIGGSNPSTQITQYGYDNNGNLTTTTDPLNRVTTNNYDALDRLVQITNPANGVTKQGYNALDQKTSVTDPRNVVTQYTSNALDDVTTTQSPDSGTTNAVFDAAGNLTQKTDARGIVANYTYDALNRLAAITYPANTAENVSFTYDSTANDNKGIGKLTGYSNDGGATVLVYDPYGNVVQQTDSIGTRIYTTAYQYGSTNRVSQITYPSGRIVYYTRNALGQITQVQTRNDAGSPLVTLINAAAYEPFGPLSSLTFGNGVATSLQHDADYRVARITTTATPLWDFVYSYDLASNLQAQADQASTYSRNFSYDGLYRVITDVNNTGSWSYGYDANGNRTNRINTSTQNLTYATTSNRLTKVGSTTQTRDAAGNLITYGTKTYTYNNASRLNTYAVSGAVKAQMQYNAVGQRTAKLQISKPLHMHYDRAGRYLGTTAFNTDGSMYQRYEWIYLDDLPVAQVRTNYSATTGAVSSRRQLYIHGDHLNTPRAMTDSARTMVWRWDGDAFGQTKPNQNPDGNSTSEILNLRFPGQYADSETGLFYNYFRDYDPSTGRYLQSDPIGLEGGLNTYAYVNGDPLSYSDPSGLGPISAAACILAIEVGDHYMNADALADLMDSVESLREQIAKIDERMEDECDLSKQAALKKIRDELVADYLKILKQNAPALYPNPAEALAQHVATDVGCGLLLRAPGW